MEKLADDAKAIASRMKEIAATETPAIYRMESMSGSDLDAIGNNVALPRNPSETDYYYRTRLKSHFGVA